MVGSNRQRHWFSSAELLPLLLHAANELGEGGSRPSGDVSSILESRLPLTIMALVGLGRGLVLWLGCRCRGAFVRVLQPLHSLQISKTPRGFLRAPSSSRLWRIATPAVMRTLRLELELGVVLRHFAKLRALEVDSVAAALFETLSIDT